MSTMPNPDKLSTSISTIVDIYTLSCFKNKNESKDTDVNGDIQKENNVINFHYSKRRPYRNCI
jgi:hypothetical protein